MAEVAMIFDDRTSSGEASNAPLPEPGSFGLPAHMGARVAAMAWGAHIEVELPRNGAHPHPTIVPRINGWLANRFPASRIDAEHGLLKIAFGVDEPSEHCRGFVGEVACAAAVAVNQQDLAKVHAILAFSPSVAARYDSPVPDQLEYPVDVVSDRSTSCSTDRGL